MFSPKTQTNSRFLVVCIPVSCPSKQEIRYRKRLHIQLHLGIAHMCTIHHALPSENLVLVPHCFLMIGSSNVHDIFRSSNMAQAGKLTVQFGDFPSHVQFFVSDQQIKSHDYSIPIKSHGNFYRIPLETPSQTPFFNAIEIPMKPMEPMEHPHEIPSKRLVNLSHLIPFASTLYRPLICISWTYLRKKKRLL